MPPVARSDVVSDVSTALSEFRSQAVADDNGAKVRRPVYVPERGYRDTPVPLFGKNALNVAVKVRRYLVNRKLWKPALVTKIARGLYKRVTDGCGGRGEVRHNREAILTAAKTREGAVRG